MSKSRATFVCQNCGAVSSRWQGKCDACGEWNTLLEEGAASGIGAAIARKARKGRLFALEGLASSGAEPPRTAVGIGELDRVTGGGFVPGSVILLGGEPGIGKSTLLIQACAKLAQSGGRVAYISGEEAVAQVRLRADRLGLAQAPVALAAATSVEDIVATLGEGAALSAHRHRLDPDHVDRIGRGRARHGDTGAGLGPGADPPRQDERRLRHSGRPRHQGRADRRPARGRAHGRRRYFLRRRRRPPVPHPARPEKPLRADR